MKTLRAVICTVLGHVDHGKSSILDRIRGTTIVESEAGQITQAIGASIVPLSTINRICGSLLQALKIELTIPGLLFIDTPGHEAFTNLRKRGGNLADIAILVVDINEGFKPQTLEALEILKQYKTPFIVAANKIDLTPGWKVFPDQLLLKNIAEQDDEVVKLFERKFYNLVASLAEKNFNSERFDRVDDFTKQVAIVPCSAKKGTGIPELLMVIAGLAQRYLESSLKFNPHGQARGTILEIKQETGLGTTLDIILYDGTLKKNDNVVIGTLGEPIVTKVKALFEPMPLAEMRDKKSKFEAVSSVTAATGVKIVVLEAKNAVAGMPLMSVTKDVDSIKDEIKKEVEDVLIETDGKGVVVKADALGSLEALIRLLKEHGVEIRRATIGNISRKDIAEAETNVDRNPLLAVVLGFNVELNPECKSILEKKSVKVFTHKVIYSLIEDFEKWREEEKKRHEKEEIDKLVRPCKIQLMKGYVFRQSNPAIIGVDILAGVLKAGAPLMKDGKQITVVKGIQQEKENITSASQGKQVAASLEHVTVGRQIHENDILYSSIPEEQFRQLKKLKSYLTYEEIEILKEIALIMRKENPMWGI
jgi:translation initiation factor 5B